MAISNSAIAQQIVDLLDKWHLREEEMEQWLNGVVGGGPNLDGKYPLTDVNAVTFMVTCPAQLEYDMSIITAAGTGAIDASQAAVDQITADLVTMATHVSNAQVAAGDAAQYKADCVTLKSDCTNLAANALGSAEAAAASAVEAEGHAQTAAANAAMVPQDGATGATGPTGADGPAGASYAHQYTPLTTSGNITIDGAVDSIKHLEVTDAVPVEITLVNYVAGQPIIILVHNVGGAVVTFAATDFVVADNRAGAGDVSTVPGAIVLINGYYDGELLKGVLA